MSATYQLVIVGIVLLATVPGGMLQSSQCPLDSLVLYHITLRTHWNALTFPRHYPDREHGYRPSAQWSRAIGRSHNSSYALWRNGEMASPGLKKFAEQASSDGLDEMSSVGIFDAFNAPNIQGGEGQTHTKFFVDGSHSMVSLICRIVPSPDWFCGVDSIDLCKNGKWLDTLSVDMDPIDAGTDNGYTFSAPNWETTPQEPIHPIYSVKLHPAHSFYKEDKTERTKSFATITVFKLKEYSLSALHAVSSDNFNLIDPVYHHLLDDIEQNDAVNEVPEFTDGRGDDYKLTLPRFIPSKRKRSRRLRGHHHRSDCVVSQFSEWSDCSALCGIGEQRRSRYIKNHPKGPSAQACPPLTEKRLCNSTRECRDNYFDW